MVVSIADGSLLAVLILLTLRAVDKLTQSVGSASLFRRTVLVGATSFLHVGLGDVAHVLRLMQTDFGQLKGHTARVTSVFVLLAPVDWLASTFSTTPGVAIVASGFEPFAAIITHLELGTRFVRIVALAPKFLSPGEGHSGGSSIATDGTLAQSDILNAGLDDG